MIPLSGAPARPHRAAGIDKTGFFEIDGVIACYDAFRRVRVGV